MKNTQKTYPKHYSKETQVVLAMLYDDGITINKSLADALENRHKNGEKTAYNVLVDRISNYPLAY